MGKTLKQLGTALSPLDPTVMLYSMAEDMSTRLSNSIINLVVSSIKKQLYSVISYNEMDRRFYFLGNILRAIDKEKFDKYAVPKDRSFISGTDDRLADMTLSDARYICRVSKDDYMIVNCENVSHSSAYAEGDDHRVVTSLESTCVLTVYLIGKHHIKLKKSIETRIEEMKYGASKTIQNTIPVSYIRSGDINFTSARARKYDDIILTDEIRNRLISGITSWKQNSEWYAKHNLPHKLGILLYGKPGTGKSSIAKAIATEIGSPLMVVNAFTISESEPEIIREISHRGTSIILIDDIDMAFESRTSMNQESECDDEKYVYDDDDSRCYPTPSFRRRGTRSSRGSNMMSNQHVLFNLLDGPLTPENVIFVATTNRRDVLDPALIRPGRFDIQLDIDYFDEDRAIKFMKLMGYDKDTLEKLNDISYPIQPAELQSKLLEYRASELYDRQA